MMDHLLTLISYTQSALNVTPNSSTDADQEFVVMLATCDKLVPIYRGMSPISVHSDERLCRPTIRQSVFAVGMADSAQLAAHISMYLRKNASGHLYERSRQYKYCPAS